MQHLHQPPISTRNPYATWLSLTESRAPFLGKTDVVPDDGDDTIRQLSDETRFAPCTRGLRGAAGEDACVPKLFM